MQCVHLCVGLVRGKLVMLSCTARTLSSLALLQGYMLEFNEHTFKNHFQMGKEENREVLEEPLVGTKRT